LLLQLLPSSVVCAGAAGAIAVGALQVAVVPLASKKQRYKMLVLCKDLRLQRQQDCYRSQCPLWVLCRAPANTIYNVLQIDGSNRVSAQVIAASEQAAAQNEAANRAVL